MSAVDSLPRELAKGRTQQKLRTRNALLDAARELIAKGETPTVEDAAAHSRISRTTAYRYFKNQGELLAAAQPELDTKTLLPPNASRDPAERLEVVLTRIERMILGSEAQYRTMLRLALENPADRERLLLRRGRAIAWIEEALSPLESKMSKAKLRRLVLAIRTTFGIEALVWLVDVAGLSRAEAAKNMRWAALTLLRAAQAER